LYRFLPEQNKSVSKIVSNTESITETNKLTSNTYTNSNQLLGSRMYACVEWFCYDMLLACHNFWSHYKKYTIIAAHNVYITYHMQTWLQYQYDTNKLFLESNCSMSINIKYYTNCICSIILHKKNTIKNNKTFLVCSTENTRIIISTHHFHKTAQKLLSSSCYPSLPAVLGYMFSKNSARR